MGHQLSEIGVVTDTGNLEVTENGEKVAQVPAEILTDAPLYDPEYREPTYLLETREFSAKSIPVPSLDEINQILLRLLESPNIVSKRCLAHLFSRNLSGIRDRPGFPQFESQISETGGSGASLASVGHRQRAFSGYRCKWQASLS